MNSTFMIALGLLSVVLGYGLWNLQKWAWLAGIILSVVGILAGLTFSALGDITGLVEVVRGLIITGYLLSYNVKVAFEKV